MLVGHGSSKTHNPTRPIILFFSAFTLTARNSFFLYSRADFYRRAWRSKSGTHLRTSAKLKSDRKHYNYTPKIWKNHIAQPENNLINAVLNYDHQLALV